MSSMLMLTAQRKLITVIVFIITVQSFLLDARREISPRGLSTEEGSAVAPTAKPSNVSYNLLPSTSQSNVYLPLTLSSNGDGSESSGLSISSGESTISPSISAAGTSLMSTTNYRTLIQLPPLQQALVIHKHVYVHVSPNEQEFQPSRKPLILPPLQKHYKIIFIKTPALPTARILPILPPQSEEKTLVYVLVKRPDEPEFVLSTPAPTQPSKPEVYFIRYKTQKAAHSSPDAGGGGSSYSSAITMPMIGTGDYGSRLERHR